MVKHPAYTRQSLQIRERCGFESRRSIQLVIVLITCLLISTVADARNFIAKSVWLNMITIQILLFALIVHEMRILEFEMQNSGSF